MKQLMDLVSLLPRNNAEQKEAATAKLMSSTNDVSR